MKNKDVAIELLNSAVGGYFRGLSKAIMESGTDVDEIAKLVAESKDEYKT